MSFTNSPPVLVPSNHSLYTPSYPTNVLLPIKCEDLDLEPSLPITRKVVSQYSTSIQLSTSTQSSSSDPKDPIQYQKLKMNYLRKLNVIPIVSQKDVLTVLGKEQSTRVPKPKKSLGKVSKAKTLKSETRESSFIPSFLPSSVVSSKPIAIPPRSHSKKLPPVVPPEELEKGDISSGTPGFHATSVIPDHFAIFFREFEL